jgi:TRAP-type C4-dicarboxylate transport system permease small subunit
VTPADGAIGGGAPDSVTRPAASVHPDPELFAHAPAILPRAGVLGTIQRGLDVVNLILAVASAIAIAVAGGVLTWEVIGRYFLGIASDWQDELSTFLLIGATFASAAWTQARRGHVGIEALSAVLPPKADRVRRFLADLIACLFCGFFAWKSWVLLAEAWQEGQTTSSSWGPPLWIPYACMTFGMALLSLQLLVQTVQWRAQAAAPNVAPADNEDAARGAAMSIRRKLQ